MSNTTHEPSSVGSKETFDPQDSKETQMVLPHQKRVGIGRATDPSMPQAGPGEYGASFSPRAYDPKTAEEIIFSRPMPALTEIKTSEELPVSAMAISPPASNAVPGVGSITELARSLLYDPQLCYEFVANNINYYPIHGLHKGGWGALLDGQGTAFDLSMLLVELLRASGINANYLVGQITLTAAQFSNWIGCETTPAWAGPRLLQFGQIPHTYTWTAPDNLETVTMTHCWVKWQDPSDMQWKMFDPSFKQMTYQAGIDVESASGFDQTAFLNDATTGATITSTSVQNLNRGNIRSDLSSYTMNLIDWIKTNNHAASVDDILGGRTINWVTLPVLQANLPYQTPGDTPTEHTALPTAYKVTVRLTSSDLDVTYTSDQIYGHRLAAWMRTDLSASDAYLDDVLIGVANNVGITVAITHNAYADTSYNINLPVYFNFDRKLLVGLGFGTCGKGLMDHHRARREEAVVCESQPVSSQPGLSPAFAEGWHAYLAHFSRTMDFTGRIANTNGTIHHMLAAIRVNESGAITDNLIQIDGRSFNYQILHHGGNFQKERACNQTVSIHNGALEHLSLQDSFEVDGIGGDRVLDLAVSLGHQITAEPPGGDRSVRPQNSAYYYAGIQPPASAYGYWIWFANGAFLTVIGVSKGGGLAEDCNLIPPWKPCPTPGGFPGSGGSGGGGTPNACCPPLVTTDISTGSAPFPYGLTFERRHSNCDKCDQRSLGKGWTHNWDFSLHVLTDVTQGMGEDSPIDGAASIMSFFVHFKLLDTATTPANVPLEQIVTLACTCVWWVDQLYKNTVAIEMSGGSQAFVKLPDGTYNPPPGVSATLIKNGDGTYTYRTFQGVTWNFNSDKKLASWTYPSGPQIDLTYSAGKLSNVANNNGRQLNLVYSGDNLSEVNDGTGRSVTYSVNAATKQLDSFTDAEGKVFSYGYDGAGRLEKAFAPANPTTPVFTRSFDTLGRVKSVKNARDQETQFFCAGPRSVEIDPLGHSFARYFNAQGNCTHAIDYLGNQTTFQWDNLSRMFNKTMPEGNFFFFGYDEKNNLVNITAYPKPGSPLAPLTVLFTYDPVWNKVKTIQDPMGRITTLNYDPANGNLLSVVYPTVDGQTPQEVFTWNSRGQLLTATDPTSIVTQFNWDTTTEKLLSVVQDFGVGRLNLTTSFSYDAAGNVASVTNPRGFTSSAVFDDNRRITETQAPSPFNFLTRFTWDDNSNLRMVEKETGDLLNPWQTTQMTYSVTDKLTSIIDPSNHSSLFVYDNADRLWKSQDAEARIYELAYDELDRILTVKDPAGVIAETRTYSQNGLLATVKDANNNITQFTTDGFDRPDKTIYPNGSFEQVTLYDANSNPLKVRNRAAQILNNTFDTLNRLKTRAPAGLSTQTMTFDLAGRLLKVSTPIVAGEPGSGDHQFFFDTAGRLVQERTPDGKNVTYGLDENGNISRLTYPDNYFVDYVMDALDRLTDIKLNGSAIAAAHFDLDKLSRRTKLTLGNGCVTDYGYELDDDLSTLAHTFVGSAVTFTHSFDNTNKLTSQSVSDPLFMWHRAA